MRSREQQRAQKTWACLTGRFGTDATTWKSKAEAYLTAARKAPAMIHTSGLGQALAFLGSRGQTDAPPRLVAQDMSQLTLELLGEQGDNLLARIRSEGTDVSFLCLATEEALSVLGWLCRYLEGADVKTEEETQVSEEGDEE